MSALSKLRIPLAVAAAALVAMVAVGATCLATSANAASEPKVFTATAQITATFDADGAITVPDVELTNDTGRAIVLKSAAVQSEYPFVSGWTNDAAGKTIGSGETLTIKWAADSKVPDDWNTSDRARVGTIVYTYEFAKIDISDAVIATEELTYNGQEQAAKIKSVTLADGTVLGEGDYRVVSGNTGTNAGEYDSLTIQGTGDYAGQATGSFAINPQVPDMSGMKLAQDTFTYDGTAKTPAVEGIPAGLVQGTDYEVSYASNVNAGSAKATVTFKGNYAGSRDFGFTIEPRQLTEAELAAIQLDIPAGDYAYDAAAKEPSLTGVPAGLVQGTDYDVAYANNVNATTAELPAKATVTFKGNYAGSKELDFAITKKTVSISWIPEGEAGYDYDGSSHSPFAVVEGAVAGQSLSAELSYEDSEGAPLAGAPSAAGYYTATVSGLQAGEGTDVLNYALPATGLAKQFTVVPQTPDMSAMKLAQDTFTYDGTAKTPAVEGIPAGLVQGTDYDVAYADSVNAGTGKATVTFKGNYTGIKNLEFTINPRQLTDEELAAIVLAIPAEGYTYDGTAHKPSVTGAPAGLVQGTDYDVAYADNVNAGTAKATVTFKGNYAGSKELDFAIAKRTVGITWDSDDDAVYFYDGTAKSPAATVTNVVEGEALAAELSYVDSDGLPLTGAPSEAGSYTVSVVGLTSGGKASPSNYQLPASGLTRSFSISKEPYGYWLAAARASNPSDPEGVLKTKSQIDEDMAVLHGAKAQTSAGKDKAAVTAEYTNYMNGMNADGSASQEVRLYTKWNGSDAEKDADNWVEFRIIQVGPHDGDGSAVTFLATHSLPVCKQMNGSDTNDGGWASSQMRTDVFGEGGYVQTGLSDLAKAAMTISKKATVGSSESGWTEGSTNDKFWLISYSELAGEDKLSCYKNEGSQYDWCVNNVKEPTNVNDALRRIGWTRNGSCPSGSFMGVWSLRSPFIENAAAFGLVWSYGDPGTYHGSASGYTGVAPAFAM